MDTIGSRIVLQRNNRRWTQAHLAQELGIAQSVLSDMENDKISPKWDLISKIAEKLDVPVLSLLPANTNNVIQSQFSDQASNIMNQYSNPQQELKLMEMLLKTKDALLEEKNKLIKLLEANAKKP